MSNSYISYSIQRASSTELTRRKRDDERKMPAVVAKRNARERTRVHTVNQAFLVLKQHLPSLRQFTKRVSKLRILNAAINYIETLVRVIQSNDVLVTLSPKITKPLKFDLTSDTSLIEYHHNSTLSTTTTTTIGSIPAVFSTPQPSTIPYMKNLLDYPSYLYQPQIPSQSQILVGNQLVQMPTYQCM